ncbi:MAG TPA: GntR family transcriptional regulator [Euzebyales bacterium]
MNVSPVDPLDDRAAYKQVADHLRDLIDEGELGPGDKLPSETDLMRLLATSRATVRNALDALASEGRVHSRRGVGVFVTDTRRIVVRDPARLLQGRTAEEQQNPHEHDAEQQGFEYTQQPVRCMEVTADERVAQLLDVSLGDTVFARKRIVRLKRPGGERFEPAKIANGFMPLDIAVGRIREPNTGPGGSYTRIREQGHELTHFVEQLVFRMPDPTEMRRLRIGPGIPVIDQTRVAYASGRPVECFLAVLAGDKNELEYRIAADEASAMPQPLPLPVAQRAQGERAARGRVSADVIEGVIDAEGDRPVYKQIADLIRDHIDRRVLAPDDQLPSESALMRRFGVTRTTVRRAITALTTEGRVRTERGVGAFVKEVVRSDAFVRQPYDRLARHHFRDEGISPISIDAATRGLAPHDVHQDRVQLADVPAPLKVADWLGVERGAPVFRRSHRIRMGRPPTQLTNTYLPLDIATGPLHEEKTGAGGTYALLEEAGFELTHFIERLSVRMPTPVEARALRLDDGVPVVDLYQTAYADDRPVECFVSVIAGDRYVFTYRIDAD